MFKEGDLVRGLNTGRLYVIMERIPVLESTDLTGYRLLIIDTVEHDSKKMLTMTYALESNLLLENPK